MTRPSALCGLILMMSLSAHVAAQVLGGDPTFSPVNEIRWDMKANEIKSLCESWKIQARATDSTLIFQARFFEASTRAKIQFDRTSQLPQLIEIAFEEATSATHDTLISYFTKRIGKPPLLTTREKNAIIFTIKMEAASWRVGNEMISVMTMMRGGDILGVNLLISRATAAPKT